MDSILGVSVRDFVVSLGFAPTMEATLAQAKTENFLEIMREEPPQLYPGVRETIEFLVGRIRLSVVTSCQQEIIESLLQHEPRFFSLFEFFITEESCSRTKPDPEPFLTCLERFCLTADDVIAVEDSEAGVASARAAGLCVIAVTHTTPRARLTQERTIVIDNFRELVNIFSQGALL